MPLRERELALLGKMADQERRSVHAQASHLIASALDRWEAEQNLERSLKGERDLEEVA